MEKKREFRHDYLSLNKQDRFLQGDIATNLEKDEVNIKFNIKGITYLLPYRDFIVVTKPVNNFKSLGNWAKES